MTRERTDAERLDFLEKEANDDPLLLHNLRTTGGAFRGLGLACTGRPLRKAIDDMMYATPESRDDIGQAKKAVANWNAAHPVGTAVVVTKDRGKQVNTKTRSEAQIGGGGVVAVIFLEGISGYYALERVRPSGGNDG